MRGNRLATVSLLVAVLVALGAPAASAELVHTVEPGESLSSIAAVDGVSVSALAAANGMSTDAQLIAGDDVVIPDASSSDASPSHASAGGSYVVQPGDTLSQIALRAGVSTQALAAANGLSVDGVLVAGRALVLPGAGSSGSAVSSDSTGGSASDGPYATDESVSPSEIAGLASSHGVPPALSTAVAYQESGFRNDLVSSADARGVMQILPRTWRFIQDDIAGHRLDPASAYENVHAGVMYLGYLLSRAGGDPATAVAGYYQGLDSVVRNGLLPDTRRYVDSVIALRDRFAGGG